MIIDNHADEYPYYTEMMRGVRQEEFITVEELIVQTDTFMRRIATLAKRGELPNTVFFLDKNARPIGYMFRILFPHYCPNYHLPTIRYIDIGHHHSLNKKSWFDGNPEIIREVYGRWVNEGTILIVDDYKDDGGTIALASGSFSRAFPESTVSVEVVYDKIPNWIENRTFLGVAEITDFNLEDIAVQEYNVKYGTKYANMGEYMDVALDNEEIQQQFTQVYNALLGIIPHVKRGMHQRNNLLLGRKVNAFRESRKELDKLCEAILSRQAVVSQEMY